ncbi:MAG: hypothetical protein OJF48_003436 [Afipia sp.]|jgi:hypothetical protein|nr:MAG: hypothetical protein OJF48_003436 [Afipia sp.]
MIGGAVSDIERAYDRAARDMHQVEREIANYLRYERPSPDSVSGRILASLEAKRDRNMPALIELKKAYDAARPKPGAGYGSTIRFKAQEWHPAGTLTPAHNIIPELPAFLRRAPAC